MNLLFRPSSAPGRTEPSTRRIRRRKPTLETLEGRAFLSIGYAAASYSIAPAISASSPAALVAQPGQAQISDSAEVVLRHAVAD
jgi:hypothetical protein